MLARGHMADKKGPLQSSVTIRAIVVGVVSVPGGLCGRSVSGR